MQRSDQILCQLLTQSAAQSVFILGNRAASVASELSGFTTAGITAESWPKLVSCPLTGGSEPSGFPLRNIASFDLVYLTDLPGDSDSRLISPETLHCLARIKGFCQGELWFEYMQRRGLATDNQFSALGFSRALLDRHDETGFAVYRYSLHSYKSTPDWLNSKHWANPERWNLD